MTSNSQFDPINAPPDPNEDEIEKIITYLCKRAFRDVRSSVGLVPLQVKMEITYPRQDAGMMDLAHTVEMTMQVDKAGFEEAFDKYLKNRILRDAKKILNGEDEEEDGDELP